MFATILLGRATGLAIAAGLTLLLGGLTSRSAREPKGAAGTDRTGAVLKSGRRRLAVRSGPAIL